MSVLRVCGESYAAWEFSTLPRVPQLRTTRFLLAFAGASVVAALAMGIPTDVIPNPWYQRMTPVRPLDVAMLPALSIVVGALVATYALPGARAFSSLSAGSGSGLLGTFAIGCPVCNKVVILVLGYSGALAYFAPVQPALAAAGLVLASIALRGRLRALARGCSIDSSPDQRGVLAAQTLPKRR